MITVSELVAEALGSYLAEHFGRSFGSTEAGLAELIPSAARLALDCIGNSDALYHNVEHTMLVTLVGHDIMRGRALLVPTSASDFAHVIVSCLFHDIGYVRGILPGDDEFGYVIDGKGGKVKLARGASDAALTPYHVERSKLFAVDRLAKMDLLDAAERATWQRHLLVLLGGGLVTGLGQLLLGRLPSGNSTDVVAAISLHGGRLPVPRAVGGAVLSRITSTTTRNPMNRLPVQGSFAT